MNAQQADSVLDTCSMIFQSFCHIHGMRIKRNDHFEGVNRVFEWTEGGILKAITIEFTYSERPAFEISMKAFSRIGLFLHRYGGVLRHLVPLWQWHNRQTEVELPRDIERLPGLLENAYQNLSGIGITSLCKAKQK